MNRLSLLSRVAMVKRWSAVNRSAEVTDRSLTNPAVACSKGLVLSGLSMVLLRVQLLRLGPYGYVRAILASVLS
jgi:hypothetical protein